MPGAVRALLISLLLLGAASSAAAQVDVEQARVRFDEGTRLYAAGQYIDAAHAYEASYALSPRSPTLLNIATSYERALELGRAADALDRYLAAEPNAPNAAEVRARAARLRELAGGAQPSPSPTTSAPVEWTPAPRPSAPQISTFGVLAAAVGGVAVLVTVGALIAGGVALDANTTVNARCNAAGVCESTAYDAVETARSASVAADVLGTIGATLGAGAVLFTVLALLEGQGASDAAVLDANGVGVRF